MHWMLAIALLWAVIYVSSLAVALAAKVLLPISAFQAALTGLLVGLVGVLYVVGTYVDQRLVAILGDLARLERPTVTVEGQQDFERIIEELEDDQ